MTPDDDASPLLTWTEEGEPRSGRFGDVYFSAEDGLAESRAVQAARAAGHPLQCLSEPVE